MLIIKDIAFKMFITKSGDLFINKILNTCVLVIEQRNKYSTTLTMLHCFSHGNFQEIITFSFIPECWLKCSV